MAELATELKKQSQEAITLIQESGVEIIPIPAQTELENFYAVHDRVAPKLSGEVYPKELLDRIRQRRVESVDVSPISNIKDVVRYLRDAKTFIELDSR